MNYMYNKCYVKFVNNIYIYLNKQSHKIFAGMLIR